MNNFRIKGYGKALPEKVVTNDDLSLLVDTSDEWIVQRTGIRERRISDKLTSELATEAALDALKTANIVADTIDLIICATMTPDNFTPGVANLVHRNLGLNGKTITAFDINAACSGFIYALKVASSLLSSGHKRALVIGCETMSRIIDFSDRNTCILFGDGAGALVLESDDKASEAYFYTNSLGNEEILYAKGPSININLNNKEVNGGFLKMDGPEVYKFALQVNEDAIKKIFSISGKSIEDIKMIIPHQANLRIIAGVAKKLKIADEMFFVNLNNYGNTSAASVAIAMCEAFEQGKIKAGDKVVLLGFGAGLTWGSALLEI